jgi:hypothetical protein
LSLGPREAEVTTAPTLSRTVPNRRRMRMTECKAYPSNSQSQSLNNMHMGLQNLPHALACACYEGREPFFFFTFLQRQTELEVSCT